MSLPPLLLKIPLQSVSAIPAVAQCSMILHLHIIMLSWTQYLQTPLFPRLCLANTFHILPAIQKTTHISLSYKPCVVKKAVNSYYGTDTVIKLNLDVVQLYSTFLLGSSTKREG